MGVYKILASSCDETVVFFLWSYRGLLCYSFQSF